MSNKPTQITASNTSGPQNPSKAKVEEPPFRPGTPKKSPTIKRQTPNEDKVPKLYETTGKRGGIYFKLSGHNISVYDEEKKERRMIRYCPGERSIYVDEQSKSALREHVIFRDKMLSVPYDKPALRAYLDAHPGNEANGGGLFRLVNKALNIEKAVEDDFLQSDAITLIKSKTMEELIPVAMQLNIDRNQTDLNIKHSLVREAKRNPQKVIDSFDSPTVLTRASVVQAFDFDLVTEKNGQIIWKDTGKVVLSIPVGREAVDMMTQFCMTDRGVPVIEEINRQLNALA